MRRKSEFNKTGSTTRGWSLDEPDIEYGKMTPDELVEHLIDENGLAAFIDIQQANRPQDEWDWREITLHLQGFSKGYLTFSPEYLEDLYRMQKARAVVA